MEAPEGPGDAMGDGSLSLLQRLLLFGAFYRQKGNEGKKRLGFTGRRCLSLLTNSFLVIIYWKK